MPESKTNFQYFLDWLGENTLEAILLVLFFGAVLEEIIRAFWDQR